MKALIKNGMNLIPFRRIGFGTIIIAMVSAVLMLSALPSSAHVGDSEVTSTVCPDASTMSATYKVGWTKGTATGKLYQRSGLHGSSGNAGSSTSGWTFVKNVSGAIGSETFTINHDKASFSGGNGPWWSSKVIFSDGYGVAADTRVEKFDWNKCQTQPNPPNQGIDCTYIYRDFGRALKYGDHINVTIERANKSQYQVNVTVDRNIAGGYETLGLRYSDGTTRPLTEEEVMKGRIWLDLSTKVKDAFYKVQFVQINESENWPELECGTPLPPTELPLPTVPVIDECGPNNARFGEVPTGQFTVVRNNDGSITLNANAGYVFPGKKTSVTLPAPTDSNVACPVTETPEVPTAPSSGDVCEPAKGMTNDWLRIPNDPNFQYTWNGGLIAPGKYPAVHNRYVIKAVPLDGTVLKDGATDRWLLAFTKKDCNRVTPVKAGVKKLQKCGPDGRFYKAQKSHRVVYKVHGKVIREGVWLKAGAKRVVVRAYAVSDRYKLVGKAKWVFQYPLKPCPAPPINPPDSGM